LTILSKKYNLKRLQGSCQSSLITIAEEIRRAVVQVSKGKMAWGQFLDYPHSIVQTGVYGTATAIKILTMTGEPLASDFVQSGMAWIMEINSDKASRASKKKDWGLIYKWCYFLESLEPNTQEINETSLNAKYFRELLNRQLPNDGWGEYFYSNDYRDPNGTIFATSFALFALRRYLPFAKSKEGKDAVQWFCKKVLDQPEVNSVTLAFAVITVSDYVQTHQELQQAFSSLVDKLEGKVQEFGNKISLSEYLYHYSVENKETSISEGKYIYLPTNAVVSYALILSNKYHGNMRYINRSVSLYLSSISKHKGYVNPEVSSRKCTVDHYWIVLLIKAFTNITQIEKLNSIKLFFKRNKSLYWLLTIFASIVILVAVFFIIHKLDGNKWYNSLSAIIVITANVLLRRLIK